MIAGYLLIDLVASMSWEDLQKETDTAHFQVALTRQEVATLRDT